MIYLINNDVEFIYEKNILRSRELGVDQVLLVPSSRILKFLIENEGDLISQKELFKVGWGDKIEYVTNNAFYQNILLLRKAFESLNQPNNIIINIPRKGYRLNENIVIDKIVESIESIE
ncbi:MAG TPA: hypothetical protein DD649_05930, partial [Providencia sp.]